MRADAPAHLHLGAAHVTARVAALETDRIEPGASVHGAADAGSSRSVPWQAIGWCCAMPSATRTIGGGVVIDPFPPRRGRRTPDRLAQLAALEHPEPADALRALLRTAAGLDRPRQLLPLAQPVAGGSGRCSASGTRCRRGYATDDSGHARGTAQGCDEAPGGASCRGARPAGTAIRAPASGDAGPPASRHVARDHRNDVPQRRPGTGRTVAASALASRHALRTRRTFVDPRARVDRRRQVPAAAHARSGTGPVGAGDGDAHPAETPAADGAHHRGGAGPVLHERDGCGDGCDRRRASRDAADQHAHRGGVS